MAQPYAVQVYEFFQLHSAPLLILLEHDVEKLMHVCPLPGKVIWGSESRKNFHLEGRTQCPAESPYQLTDGRKNADTKKGEERGTVWCV